MAGKLNPKEIQALEQKLQKISEYAKQLGKNIDVIKLKPVEENAKAIEALFISMNKELQEMNKSVDSIFGTFSNLNKAIRSSNSNLNKTKTSLSSVLSLSKQISKESQSSEKINKNSTKTQKELNKEMSEGAKNAKKTSSFMSEIQKGLEQSKGGAFFSGLFKAVGFAKNLGKELIKARKESKAAGKEETSKVSNLAKLRKKEGDAIGANAQLQSRGNANMGKGGKIVGGLKKGIGGIGKMFKGIIKGAKMLGGALMRALGPIGLIASFVTKIIDGFSQYDNMVGEISHGMGMTSDEAAKVLDTQTKLGKTKFGIVTKDILATTMNINKALGTTGKLADEDAMAFSVMQKFGKLTNEEIAGMAKQSAVSGLSAKELVNTFQGQAKAQKFNLGVAINTKDLMKDMGKLNKSTLLIYGKQTAALAKTMVTVKALGMNMAQVDKIAGGLLDFESSIQAEMEAELLTGKQLNLEKARQAALNNDLKTVAEEIAKNAGSAADFANMNRLQQEAMAKAVGMSREEMSAMLYEQEALKSMGRELNDQEQKAYELAKEKYGAEKAAEMLGEGQLERMEKEATEQEKMKAAQDEMNEVFLELGKTLSKVVKKLTSFFNKLQPIINAVSSILVPVFEVLVDIMTIMIEHTIEIGMLLWEYLISPFESFKEMFSIFGDDTLSLGQKIKKLGITLVNFISKPFEVLANMGISILNTLIKGANLIPGVSIPLIPKVSFAISTADDMLAQAGYGKRMLLTESGPIALNNQDTIIAGTNIGDDVKSEPGKGVKKMAKGQLKSEKTMGVDMSETNSLLKTMITLLQYPA